jgi:NAD(P)-dependent dehydrogenase (short-subunit alcohol dehydrogenase family)
MAVEQEALNPPKENDIMRKGVAWVTGASRGIGRGIAIELARHGFDIAAGTTHADPANTEKGVYEVKARVEELGRECLPVAGDLSDPDTHERMLAEVIGRFGALDVLVNNAGVAPLQRMDLLECSRASYDRVMDINLRGPFFLTQTVARHMASQANKEAERPPTIVFITSISADTASPNRAEYCISKAGLSMAAQTFAVRLAEYGVNVYEIRPGIVATDMTEAVKERYDRLMADGLLLQPRWGQPEDIGKAVAALADGAFAYATGAVIELGGGFGVKRL